MSSGGAVVFIGVQRTGKHGRGAASPGVLRIDGEEGGVALGGAGVEMFGGDIHDFPVPKFSTAAQGYGTGTDAAQREGDFLQVGRIITCQDRPFARGPFLCVQEEGDQQKEGRKCLFHGTQR